MRILEIEGKDLTIFSIFTSFLHTLEHRNNILDIYQELIGLGHISLWRSLEAQALLSV